MLYFLFFGVDEGFDFFVDEVKLMTVLGFQFFKRLNFIEDGFFLTFYFVDDIPYLL